MNHDIRPRPVSGEIMTDAQVPSGLRPVMGDIADADYVTLEPHQPPSPARFPDARPVTGMDYLKAGVAAVDAGSRNGGPLFWGVGLAMVALAFWVSGGHALVRAQAAAILPEDTAREQTLQIRDVTSRVERHNDRNVLFVKGNAENLGASARSLPPFEIVVTAADSTSTRYFLGTNAASLAPGDRYSFSSRVVAPRNGVKSVSVTFREDQR